MNNKSNSTLSLTEGDIFKVILFFAVPILVGNIFQQLYNVVDTAVIGNILGDNSLAAVGATAPVYNLIIGFSCGITNGFSVIIARFFGAEDEKNLNKAVSLTVLLTIIISIILTIMGIISLSPLTAFLKIEENIIKESKGYLGVIIAFSSITMLYNMLSGMLRAIGNSKIPLLSLIIATIINVVLDIVFVKYLHMGVAGAAYATIAAQVVSVVFCIIYIIIKCPVLMVKKEYLAPDKYITKELLTTGISMGLMIAVVMIGSVVLQIAVNSLGSATTAAHTAGRKIDDMLMLPLLTISIAASTFASQNFGAGKNDRVQKGIIISIKLAMIWSALSCLIVFCFGKGMIKILTGSTNSVVIDTAAQYIFINVPFFFVLSVLLILRSCLQGIGRKIVPLSASTIEFLAKFIAVGFVTPVLGYLGVCIIEPIIWIICAVLVSLDFRMYQKQIPYYNLMNKTDSK